MISGCPYSMPTRADDFAELIGVSRPRRQDRAPFGAPGRVIEGEDPRLFFHSHDIRYGNSTDFGCHQGLIRETVRSFSCEASAYTRGDHSAIVTLDVEAVRGVRGGVQGDAQDVGVPGDRVPDPPAVVVGQGGAVRGEHQAVVGVPAEVPDGGPARGSSAFPVSRRHGEHDLDAFAGGDALEGLVDQVQVAGLHLLAVGEDRCERAR